MKTPKQITKPKAYVPRSVLPQINSFASFEDYKRVIRKMKEINSVVDIWIQEAK